MCANCMCVCVCAYVAGMQVLASAESAVQAALKKQSKKVQGTEALAASTTDSRQRTELEGAVKNEAAKLKKVQEVVSALEALKCEWAG
jgi:hypothetical protein